MAILRAMRAQRLAVNAAAAVRLEALKGELDDPFPMIVLRGGIEFTEWFAGLVRADGGARFSTAALDERSS